MPRSVLRIRQLLHDAFVYKVADPGFHAASTGAEYPSDHLQDVFADIQGAEKYPKAQKYVAPERRAMLFITLTTKGVKRAKTTRRMKNKSVDQEVFALLIVRTRYCDYGIK